MTATVVERRTTLTVHATERHALTYDTPDFCPSSNSYAVAPVADPVAMADILDGFESLPAPDPMAVAELIDAAIGAELAARPGIFSPVSILAAEAVPPMAARELDLALRSIDHRDALARRRRQRYRGDDGDCDAGELPAIASANYTDPDLAAWRAAVKRDATTPSPQDILDGMAAARATWSAAEFLARAGGGRRGPGRYTIPRATATGASRETDE